MAAVENILASNTAPRKDVARAPSKVPFAPILASQIEARISDLAAPRAAQPANNDRFEARRDNPNDDRIRHDDRHGARDDAARADRTRADDPKHKDAPVDNREIKNIAPREADERHLTRSEPRPERAEPAPSTEAVDNREIKNIAPREADERHLTRSEPRPERAEPAPSTEAAASRSASKHESADASKSSASDTTSSETAISSENVASTKTVGASETSPAAPVPTGTASEPTATAAVDLSASPDAVAMLGEIGTASNGAKAMPNNAAPSGATGSAPVNASGSPSDAPIAPMAGDPASAPKPDGKINITGMTPSNDDTPSKIGSEVPQIVRDVQSIVARPANAAGGNLMQAQQQGDVTTGQNLNTPAKSGNATPLAHNAGQGAPLHVGGDASGNANQNAGQNGGQSANNPNGQGANGQGTNGQGTGAQAGPGQTGIAGAQPTGLPGEISTTQQAAQSFQSNLARASGPVGAGGPGAISGDGAIMARGDGTITGTGASQGTLTSDPASRAAQASTSHPGRNAPATDQVSVSLKKAVENGVGSEVPQIVRDVQSIVARPANAAGGNLMQAQQQGDVTTGQNLNTPAKSGNATPLAHNAGQGAPLHVGGDASGNANQNAGQNGGQSANNPNGQGANGQGTNGQGTGAQAGPGQTGIAGAQPTGLPGEISTTQQAAQSFQSNLARASGPVGAGGPGAISGDGAIMARGDGTITGTGASQGTLTSDPASRAAQASTSHPGRNAPATDQVSVSLKKAVENGDSKLRIQLRPHELGRVEVKLDIAGDGRAKAMVLAERPETLELLQRDSRVLERALQDAGLKTDHNSLSFDLQGRDGEDRAQHAQREDAEDKGTSTENADDGDVIDNTEQPIPATAIGFAPDGSVNFLA